MRLDLNYKTKRDRIIKILKKDPDIPSTMLAKRLGMSSPTIRKIRSENGFPEPDNTLINHKKCKTPERLPFDIRGKK